MARATDIPLHAPLQANNVDRVVPTLARQVMADFHDEDKQRHFGTLFRLQMATGDYAQAVQSIHALRALRADDATQPPVFFQYETYALAKIREASTHTTFAHTWRTTFAERFAALDDRTAQQAEFAFGGYLPRMRDDLDKALANIAGKQRLTQAEAIDVIRAWQVHAAYRAFQPLFADALAQDDARRYAIDRSALVRTPDNANLAVLTVRPRVATPLPTLLTFTIYANDDWAWADAKKMAAYGYVGVVAYSRGKGRSTDAIAPYTHDGADAAAVIDWVAQQSWSDGRVGMYGGSYSGFTQWAALKQRPKALKAIATSATVAPGIDVPMEGGVFLNFIYAWPAYTASNRTLNDATYGDTARWAGLDRNLYSSGRAYRELPAIDGSPNPLFSEWLRHPAYDDYWQRLIPQNEAFADIDIPVLATTGYFDGAQIGVLHYFREHLKHHPDADHTLLIGPYQHLSMQTGVPPTVQGYTPDAVARIDLQALRLAWFDHVFKGAPKPALLADRVNWQVMGANTWRHAHTLDAMPTQALKLHLVAGTDDGPPQLAAQSQPHAVVTQRIDFTDRSDAAKPLPEDSVHMQLDPRAGLVFTSAPMTQDTELAGAFQGVLDFSINKHDADIAIGIYELNAQGEYLDLGWWLQRASYNADRRHRQLLNPNVPQQLEVKDTRLLGRKLVAGSRLVVSLGVVKQADLQLNLGSGKEPADESIADAGEPMQIHWYGTSYLEFGVH
ncbi:CocE/NonD family hydrolase [Stenotrophomonas sp. Iso1]|uniref:CocE/NonD family hydrolase n=1 Tax=Stenotrophomonas sp. Iso1 TaxID=2977283 RepID=UPI0022B77E41|nr:CocE/NonD family hydrolase [Stenotrophomonas sp. Iso1]